MRDYVDRAKRYIQTAARREFLQTEVGQLYSLIRSARRQYRAGIPWEEFPKLADVFSSAVRSGAARQLLRLFGGAGGAELARDWALVERYARSNSWSKTLLADFLKQLGPAGKIFEPMLQKGGAGTGMPKDLRTALQFVAAYADCPDVLTALQRIVSGRGQLVSSKRVKRLAGDIEDFLQDVGVGSGQPRRPETMPVSEPGSEEGEGTGREYKTQAEVEIDGVKKRFDPSHPIITGEMIQTPESSNVYAFGYDLDHKSMYVRFKASDKRGGSGSGGRGQGGGGDFRPHVPGPIYLYHNVPPDLFLSLMQAGSKGVWLWDNVRIRGTVSGHRYDYALVGVSGGYVPRKATLTPAGEEYLPRTVFTDQGRSLTSSLPAELVRPLISPRQLGRDARPRDGRRR